MMPEAALPGPAARFDQAEAAREELETLGYVAIGIDHFARPSDALAEAARTQGLRRSFQGYVVKSGDAIIGMGPSAISTLPQGFAQNLAEPGAWTQAIEAGRPAIARGHRLTADDRVRGRLIEQIMCDFVGDLGPLGGAGGCAEQLMALAEMFADDLINIDQDRLVVTESGRPFSRLIAAAFDAHASRAAAQHAKAV